MFIVDIEGEEQQALRSAVRSLTQSRSPESAVRSIIDSGTHYDRGLWNEMATMGLTALTVPEDLGGVGGSVQDQAIVFEELGRALVPSPFLSSVAVAASLIEKLGEEASKELLPSIADGTMIATAVLETDESSGGVAALQVGDRWVLSGELRFVVDGSVADLVLVPARTASGVSVFAVETSAEGISRTPLTTLDLTRGQADLAFDGVPARLLGGEGQASPAIECALQRGILALVSEQTGAADHLLDLALDYAKTRFQFGRLIGEFQAIKHKFAEMAFDLERMKSVQAQLARALQDDSNDLPVLAHLAKAFCSEAFFRIAAETIQVHGGIGFTWEHQAHLYFRRAKSTEVLFGGPGHHREAMLRLVEAG